MLSYIWGGTANTLNFYHCVREENHSHNGQLACRTEDGILLMTLKLFILVLTNKRTILFSELLEQEWEKLHNAFKIWTSIKFQKPIPILSFFKNVPNLGIFLRLKAQFFLLLWLFSNK